MEKDKMIFVVQGFGQVGYANLDAFAPFPGFKQPGSLAVGEKAEGRFRNPTSDKKPERIVRIA